MKKIMFRAMDSSAFLVLHAINDLINIFKSAPLRTLNNFIEYLSIIWSECARIAFADRENMKNAFMTSR